MLIKCVVFGVYIVLMARGVTPRDIIKITVNDTITVGVDNSYQLSYDLNETITVLVKSSVKYHVLVCRVRHLDDSNTVYNHQFKLKPFSNRNASGFTAVNREFCATEEFKGLWNCTLIPKNPIDVKGKPQHLNFMFCLNVKDKNKADYFVCQKYKDKYKIFTERENEINIGKRVNGIGENDNKTRTAIDRHNTTNPDISNNINKGKGDTSRNANDREATRNSEYYNKNTDTTDGNNTANAITTDKKTTTYEFDIILLLIAVAAIFVFGMSIGCVIGAVFRRKRAQKVHNVPENQDFPKDFTSQKMTNDNSEAACFANATHHTSDPIYCNISSVAGAPPFTPDIQNIFNGVATSPARMNYYVNFRNDATTEEDYINCGSNIVASYEPYIDESCTDNTIYDVPHERIKTRIDYL